MKVTLIFFPNLVKKDTQTGKIPIYMRVIYMRLKSECRLNASLLGWELSKWDPITMRVQERNNPVNHQLNRMEQKLSDLLILNSTNLPAFTATSIRDYILGKDSSLKRTVTHFADEYFEKAVLHNVDRASGTIKNYRRSINHLNQYLAYIDKKNLLLEELDYEFASGFKNYLVSSYPALRKTGMTEVSASGVIKKFSFTRGDKQDYN